MSSLQSRLTNAEDAVEGEHAPTYPVAYLDPDPPAGGHGGAGTFRTEKALQAWTDTLPSHACPIVVVYDEKPAHPAH